MRAYIMLTKYVLKLTMDSFRDCKQKQCAHNKDPKILANRQHFYKLT